MRNTRLQQLEAQRLLRRVAGVGATAAKVAEEGAGGGLGVTQVQDAVQVVHIHLAAGVDGERRRQPACGARSSGETACGSWEATAYLLMTMWASFNQQQHGKSASS